MNSEVAEYFFNIFKEDITTMKKMADMQQRMMASLQRMTPDQLVPIIESNSKMTHEESEHLAEVLAKFFLTPDSGTKCSPGSAHQPA